MYDQNAKTRALRDWAVRNGTAWSPTHPTVGTRSILLELAREILECGESDQSVERILDRYVVLLASMTWEQGEFLRQHPGRA